MAWLQLSVLAVLLPLFPASMVYGLAERRIRHPLGKAVLMLAWSQLGVGLLLWWQPEVPAWFSAWALATAGLYAFRALVLNEVADWVAFLFVSVSALFWLLPPGGFSAAEVRQYALLAVVPLILLSMLSAAITSRFGTAWLGLVGGLVQSCPRLSALVVASVLAVMATPPFPQFLVMIQLLTGSPFAVSVAMLGVWYLWGWAGVRFMQRLVLGGAPGNPPLAEARLSDLAAWQVAASVVLFAGLAALGVAEGLQLAGGGR